MQEDILSLDWTDADGQALPALIERYKVCHASKTIMNTQLRISGDLPRVEK
jgi:hypothetical protein